MANTYTRLYVQLVFAVKNHQSVIHESNRVCIEKYICGITKNIKCNPIAIYCNPDHLHFLIGLHQTSSVSEIARGIKCSSSRFINENRLVRGHFEWQIGYGAFSYSQSHIEAVCKYIVNQPIHHRKRSFRDEYLALLKAFEIEFNDKYIFDWLE